MNKVTITTVLSVLFLSQATLAKAVTLFGVDASFIPEPVDNTIRVKVFPHDGQLPQTEETNKKAITLRSTNECMVFGAESARTSPKSEWLQTAQVVDLTVKDSRLPLWIRCPSTVSLWAKDAEQGYNYRGDLYVHKILNAAGKEELEVVNVLDLEEYLRGVVPAEVYANWPRETLKTQAVAARTYALFHMMSSRIEAPDRFFDVDDTVRFQAYMGMQVEHHNTNGAIEDTRGEVITYRDAIIPAFYHADSGGMTERGEDVWNKPVPFVRVRKDVVISKEAPSSWTLKAPLQNLQKRLNALTGKTLADVVKIAIKDDARTRSGRVRFVSFYDASGQEADLNVNQFRNLIGQSLPSTLFSVSLSSKAQPNLTTPNQALALNVNGQGSGHGVGLSQRGAAELGKRIDWDYRKILDFYYRGVALCRFGNSDAKSVAPSVPARVQNCNMGQLSTPIKTVSNKSPNVS